MKTWKTIAALLIAGLILNSCGSGSGGDNPTPPSAGNATWDQAVWGQAGSCRGTRGHPRRRPSSAGRQGATEVQVHDPVLLQVLVQVEGVGQSSSEQITASEQVMWQPFPVHVVLQLPVF
jgi:hypothetical protein